MFNELISFFVNSCLFFLLYCLLVIFCCWVMYFVFCIFWFAKIQSYVTEFGHILIFLCNIWYFQIKCNQKLNFINEVFEENDEDINRSKLRIRNRQRLLEAKATQSSITSSSDCLTECNLFIYNILNASWWPFFTANSAGGWLNLFILLTFKIEKLNITFYAKWLTYHQVSRNLPIVSSVIIMNTTLVCDFINSNFTIIIN